MEILNQSKKHSNGEIHFEGNLNYQGGKGGNEETEEGACNPGLHQHLQGPGT